MPLLHVRTGKVKHAYSKIAKCPSSASPLMFMLLCHSFKKSGLVELLKSIHIILYSPNYPRYLPVSDEYYGPNGEKL